MTRRMLPWIVVAVSTAWVAWAADTVTIEDWSSAPPGTRGVPPPWQKQRWGNPAYDFTEVQEDSHRFLRLHSKGDSSYITLELKEKINLRETPILTWTWRVTRLPRGADSRHKETDDQAAGLYVVWPRFPEAVRSRIIGYIWDTSAPLGAVIPSQKTGTVTYVVVRSGKAELGRWLTEARNVREDFRRIYGEEPESPGAITIGLDSDDVKDEAESAFGPLLFRRP